MEMKSIAIWVDFFSSYFSAAGLQGLHWKSLLLYLDNVIVIAADFESHLQCLEEVLSKLQLT